MCKHHENSFVHGGVTIVMGVLANVVLLKLAKVIRRFNEPAMHVKRQATQADHQKGTNPSQPITIKENWCFE